MSTTNASYARKYIILRPARGRCEGHARLELSGGLGQLTLRGSCLPVGCTELRALLVSADEASVLDLGPATVTPRGVVSLSRVGLPMRSLTDYDALALTTDWPDARLMLYGCLTDPPRCTRWQLQEAVTHYLSVPSGLDAPAPALPTSPEPPTLRPASAPPLSEESLLGLSALQWPEALLELKPYFDALPPSAPFDAPGWRFVSVPLPDGGPARRCEVGVRASAHRVVEAFYAVPGEAERVPPGLSGYRYRVGRHEQGYWTLRQTAISS